MSTFFGLDIGSTQVKALQAEKTKEGIKLSHFAVTNLDNLEPGVAVKNVVKEAGIKTTTEVNLALPESEVYTRIIQTPKLSEAELASSIQYEAEQYVPVALSEVELYHQVLEELPGREEKTMRVLLIAVTKQRLSQLTALMDRAGLIPKSLETELFSLKRLLADAKKAQVLVLLGHKTTDLMILDQGVPLFMHSVASGGLTMTKTLATELSLTDEQAEQYKRTYGLREDMLEGKVAGLLIPVADQVVVQINKAVVYLSQLGISRQPEQVVIAGGGAMLPGMSSYLVKKLNLEVIVADPFDKFVKDEQFKKLITSDVNPQLATVVGLAIKGIS